VWQAIFLSLSLDGRGTAMKTWSIFLNSIKLDKKFGELHIQPMQNSYACMVFCNFWRAQILKRSDE